MILVTIAGCGDDRDSDAVSSNEFCTDLIAVQASDPEIPEDASDEEAAEISQRFWAEELIPAVRDVRDAAPPTVVDDVSSLLVLLDEMGPAALDAPEFIKLNTRINMAAIDDCNVNALDVTAIDHAYEDAPTTIKAGPVGFRFRNAGMQDHEMLLLRKNDGTEESFDELLRLPRQEIEEKVTGFGTYFAAPGDTEARIVTLPAGAFLMVCTLPAEPADGESDSQGSPHFMLGMTHEFSVH